MLQHVIFLVLYVEQVKIMCGCMAFIPAHLILSMLAKWFNDISISSTCTCDVVQRLCGHFSATYLGTYVYPLEIFPTTDPFHPVYLLPFPYIHNWRSKASHIMQANPATHVEINQLNLCLVADNQMCVATVFIQIKVVFM